MADIPVHTNIPVMPPEMKKRMLPYSVVRILTGAKVVPNYQGKPDVVGLEWANTETEVLHVSDFELAKKVADEVWREQVEAKNLITTLMTVPTAVQLMRAADRRIERLVDEAYTDKRGIIFIKDTSGCGYWRMVVPARYMNDAEKFIDCVEVEVIYEYLLEYDTIVVQRLHNWSEFYVIEKLKRLGKRVIYDIDDDIFNIPPDNPAFKVIKRDQQEAARAIMGLCDVIVTPSEVIKQRFGFADKTVVIPNAVDIDDGWPVLSGVDEVDLSTLTPPDGIKRILWQGSPTHDEDWFECITAVDEVMQHHLDVRMVILGYLSSVVRQFIEDVRKPWWNERVEFAGFSDIETYIHVAKHLKAHVALAPLGNTPFNQAKSPLKYTEYAAMGIPCIASNVTPYKEVIEDGQNGFLAGDHAEWLERIEKMLKSPEERIRIVRSARDTVAKHFDVKATAKQWEGLFS